MSTRPIHLFAFDGYSDWEPSYALAPLREMFGLRVVANGSDAVPSAGGPRVVPDLTLDQLTPGMSSLLILPGGSAWSRGAHSHAVSMALRFLRARVPVAAIGEARTAIRASDSELIFRVESAQPAKLARVLQQALTPSKPKSSELLRALTWSDPPGVTESPASRKIIVSIHLGASVRVGCRRGGQSHEGLNVHGDIDIIPPGIVSRWELRERDTAFIMRLPVPILDQAAEDLQIDPAKVEVLNRFQLRDPRLEHIGWALKAEMQSGFPSGRLFLEGLGNALASCLLARHTSVARPAAGESRGMAGRRLRDVLAHIEQNIDRELPLREIAAVAGVSVSRCNRAFRQAVGAPLHQYVIGRRVDHARALLSAGNLSISQVAAETGFAHQSHLAYHVRRLLGVSPSSLRGKPDSFVQTAR